MRATPARDIVIVGAGILGAAIAWQLGRLGQGQRVLLVDRSLPMAGSTSYAAALVTLLRRDATQIRMAQETLAAIAYFTQFLPEAVGHHPVGSLHVVPAHLSEVFSDLEAIAAHLGVRMRWVTPSQAQARAPWLHIPQGSRVLHVLDDCYVDPYQLGMAYLREAQRAGVQLALQAHVTKLCTRDGAIVGVETDRGETIEAPTVVLAAGPWTNTLAFAAGVPLPMAAVRSQYWITAESASVTRDGAIVFLPEIRAYLRPEVGGLLFGLRESRSAVVDARSLPADLSGFAFNPEDSDGWDSLIVGAPALSKYWPGFAEAQICHYVNGPSNYTLDGQLVVGPVPKIKGLWVASGCNGSGITFSAGIGRLVSEQILGTTPTYVEGTPMAPQRCGAFDPFSPNFMAACAAARASKSNG